MFNCIKKTVIAFSLCLCLTSCQTIRIQQSANKTTKELVQLGAVGDDKQTLLGKDYQNLSLPKYTQPLRVVVTVSEFEAHTFKAFQEAKQFQQSDLNLVYSDSIKERPKYVTFSFTDKVALLASINAPDNSGIKEYLANQNSSDMVTKIAVALQLEDVMAMTKAEIVLFKSTDHNTYVFQLLKDNQVYKELKLNEGIVFAYDTSSSCWKEDTKHKLQIIDLVNSNDNCPKRSYKSPHRATKEINYFKF